VLLPPPPPETASTDGRFGLYRNPVCSEHGNSNLNKQYKAIGVVHTFSTALYVIAWRQYFAQHRDCSRTLKAVLVVPDVLNTLEAIIYAKAAWLYAPISLDPLCDVSAQGSYSCERYLRLHWLELGAACIELAAAAGYIIAWLMVLDDSKWPWRGFSPLDVDLWCQVFMMLPSIVYVRFYIDILNNPSDYAINFEYKVADAMYMVGGVTYILKDLRDNGVFAWLRCGSPQFFDALDEMEPPPAPSRGAALLAESVAAVV